MRDLITTKKLIAAFSALALLTVGGGCADPEPIDRVQPNLIEKAKLVGEWYALTTVTRAPYASHDVFPGLQGTLERGVWEIEKDHLYFYRTYEFVQGLESEGIRADVDTPLVDADGKPVTYEKVMPDGTRRTVTRYVYRSAPIKRFAVSGHYDVRKQYNPMTGEESNVRVEDSSEKYWYERAWMRVDFGANSAENYGDISLGSVPVIYDGEEGPEHLRLRVEDDGRYMDFSIRGFMTAPRTYYEGYGLVPTCLFYPWYTGAYYECDEEEVHLRSSFSRVAENNSYVPQDLNDHLLNKFGYYRSERSRNDPWYNQTFSAALRYTRRFNLWDEVKRTADGGVDYPAMTEKPIVYYLSEDFPRELVGGANDLAAQWSEPFAEVVEHRTGRQLDHPMFVLCENNSAEADAARALDPSGPMASTDARYCRDMDAPKRIGDLRYNLLFSVNDPVQFGLYGYGPMHADPITGETIHANAFMYTANVRLGARTAVDMIEYEAGVQNFQDIAQAKHIETSLKARALKGTQGAPRALGVEDARAIAALALTPEVSAEMSTQAPAPVDYDLATARMNRLLQTDQFGALWMNADMAALVGLPVTALDADLTKVEGASTLRNIVHPAHLASEPVMTWKMERDTKRGAAAMCMGEHFDDSFRGLALEYKDAYDSLLCSRLKADVDAGADYVFDFDAFREPGSACPGGQDDCGANQVCQFLDQGDVSGNYCMTACSAGALLDQLRDEIRRVNEVSQFVYWDPNALYTDTKDARVQASQHAARALIEEKREQIFLEVYDRMWSTVAMHEVGHNVGLRHNFASSTDALNFFPTYWDLKGEEGAQGWEPHVVFNDDTNDQVVKRMREYQQTSIMEYTSAFNARYQGLGAYDRAAILFGYGELVEVFEHPPAFERWQGLLAEPSDADPDNYGLYQRREQPLARALRKVHHTNFPKLFGGVDNLVSRRVVDASDVADKAKPCDQHDDPYDTSVCGGGGSFCQPFLDGFFCTKPDMVEVPLRFCGDEYNRTTPDCQTWDEGTDMFEIMNNSLADYEAYWPFRAYKRDNDLFNPMSSYWANVLSTMYGWRKHFEHWALSYARYNHNGWWEKQYGVPWDKDVNGGLGDTVAMTRLFETLANVFGRPDDAYYGFNEDRKIYEPIIDNGRNSYCNVFQIREDEGARPMYPSYDFSGYLYTPARAGTFYDRLAALMVMTYPTTMFTIGIDRSYDVKRFRINFGSVWPQRMHNLLSGLLLSEPSMYGWCIEHDSATTPTADAMCTIDPVRVKPRRWFGTPAELDDYYANCAALNPEPEYTFPTTQYRIPALAAMYGYSWMSGTYDRSFIDRNRLWLAGDGTEIQIPAGFETIEYTDPFSGKTYVAAYDPAEEDPYAPVDPRDVVPDEDHELVRSSIWSAARLIAVARTELDRFGGNLSDLSNSYQFSVLQQTVGRLEILRGLYRSYEFGF